MATDRDEIRKIVEEELANAAPKKGLVIRRVGTPLGNDDLRNAGGGAASEPAPGDQCCNGCD